MGRGQAERESGVWSGVTLGPKQPKRKPRKKHETEGIAELIP